MARSDWSTLLPGFLTKDKIVYNYPPKGRWIVASFTETRSVEVYIDPEGDSCLSIYQISWIKIKKELFVSKRHHLVRVCLRSNWQCFGDHFLRFCCKFNKNFFFCRPVTPNFVSFLVFVGAAASFTAKISSFETVAKREAILNLVPKQWIIQGYSELREPIRTRQNCYTLIWWILIRASQLWSRRLFVFPHLTDGCTVRLQSQ